MFSEQQNQDIYKRRSALPERVQAVVDQIRAGIGQGRPSLAEWLTLKTQTHMQTHIHTSSYLPYIYILLFLFPNSHAMGSCKTNRRTGAVGSPSELVGGWCPGHVLMASGSCDAGVPVMF